VPSISARPRRTAPVLVTLAVGLLLAPAVVSHEAAAGRATAGRATLPPSTPELIDAAVRRGHLTEAQGGLYLAWALTSPHRLPPAYVSDTPWSGTLPLLELRRRAAALGSSPAATQLRAVLRGQSFDCPGARSLRRVKTTSHYSIRYDASALRSLSIRRYARSLETSWSTEVGRFRWARPPKDPGGAPAGRRYPVRIQNLADGLYGYVTATGVAGNNPATPWHDRDAMASCMVLNRDYGPFPGRPLDALRATAAHEFNHSIQFGYGALTGYGRVREVMVEGLATWMEDEVFDTSDDSYHYLWPDVTLPMGRYGKSPYPYWVVFRAMSERLGDGEAGGAEAPYQVFWEQISRGASTNLTALARGFKAAGTSVSDAYHDASIALRFLVGCSSTPRRFCLEEGPAYAGAAGGRQDHANLGTAPDQVTRSVANDLAMQWVGLPTQGGLDITLAHRGGRGTLRVSVACLDGGSVSVERVGTATRRRDAAVAGVDLSGCDDASAVISNVVRTSATPASITRTDFRLSIE
jgi:hypothetical protein